MGIEQSNTPENDEQTLQKSCEKIQNYSHGCQDDLLKQIKTVNALETLPPKAQDFFKNCNETSQEIINAACELFKQERAKAPDFIPDKEVAEDALNTAQKLEIGQQQDLKTAEVKRSLEEAKPKHAEAVEKFKKA